MKIVSEEKYTFTLPDGSTLTFFERANADWLDLALKDAARYRWLRNRGGCPFAETDPLWEQPDRMDIEIDAEMERIGVVP